MMNCQPVCENCKQFGLKINHETCDGMPLFSYFLRHPTLVCRPTGRHSQSWQSKPGQIKEKTAVQFVQTPAINHHIMLSRDILAYMGVC